MRQSLASLLLGSAVVAAVVLGCATVGEPPSTLPVRNAMVFDQLVIHSNFSLPQQHRLVDDLCLLRGDLMTTLDMQPSDEPIHVYLFESEDHFQDFLSRQHPEFPARRAFFVESDTRLTVYAQWGDRVAEDLRHEVSHGYLHSVVRGIPLWIDEGLAEYFEVPRSDGGLNRPHIRLLLTRWMDHQWRPDLPRLERLSSAGEMAQEDYAEAWLWTHWLLEASPQHRKLLQGYLQTLARYGSAEPLSSTVQTVESNADEALLHHLSQLAAVLTAQREAK
ncbi:MAG TPA: DUF1570 domain-containing protein [Pirellulales bacterium]|nr:DUF1570 domain-containing protein [Pirellulales bacterium]